MKIDSNAIRELFLSALCFFALRKICCRSHAHLRDFKMNCTKSRINSVCLLHLVQLPNDFVFILQKNKQFGFLKIKLQNI